MVTKTKAGERGGTHIVGTVVEGLLSKPTEPPDSHARRTAWNGLQRIRAISSSQTRSVSSGPDTRNATAPAMAAG